MANSPLSPGLPAEFFEFSGQATLEAWTFQDAFREMGWRGYDEFLSHEPELCFLRMRDLLAAFPTWQRRASVGRPAYCERTILVGLFLRQFCNATFRQTESYLRLLASFFGVEAVPDATTMSRMNREPRFVHLMRRFHAWILAQLPRRTSIIATDATGYGTAKKVWSQTDYGLRAQPEWTKAHAAIEVPQMLYLSHVTTAGRTHDSQAFADVWNGLPDNVRPTRSLADAAYSGEACLAAAKAHGATPIHAVRRDARLVRKPATDHQRLVNFTRQWPNRVRQLKGRRSLVEAAFSATKNRFGERLRCRSPIGRENEIQCKKTAHNIRVLTARHYISSG